jgi:hypothetical protein
MRHTVTNNVTISSCKQTSQAAHLLCWSHLQRRVNPRAGSSPATGTIACIQRVTKKIGEV